MFCEEVTHKRVNLDQYSQEEILLYKTISQENVSVTFKNVVKLIMLKLLLKSMFNYFTKSTYYSIKTKFKIFIYETIIYKKN